MQTFSVPKKINSILLGFTAIGIIALGVGFMVDSHRAWAGLLVLMFFLISLSLSGGFFSSLQFIAGAKWSVVIQRIPMSFVYGLIPVLVLAVALFFGIHDLYHWSHPEEVAKDHILQQKAGYLNIPFFTVRVFAYIIIWLIMGYIMRQISIKQDESKDPKKRTTLVRWSAGYLVAFSYTFMLASIDLLMSLEPHWYTTMFVIYTFANMAYLGVAAMIIMLHIIKANGGLKDVTDDHIHDMGKYQFMFTVFWAYIAFSQFMLMWYANMPEETIYLEHRIRPESGWATFTTVHWIFHFAVPFFILLSRDIKRNSGKLVKVAAFILFMGFVDIVWMVYGGIHIHGFPFSWMEAGIFLGGVGLFGYIAFNAFSKANEIPVGDPYLEESKHFHQTH